MSACEYFLAVEVEEIDLSAWASILPSVVRTIRTNLFGDHFLVDGSGAVHLLDRGGCSVECIAASEEDFWREVQQDIEAWQLRPLADACRISGKVLAAEHCYAFTTLPVLGGAYAVDNVWVAPRREWFSLTADMFKQIETLPDGATVSIKITD